MWFLKLIGWIVLGAIIIFVPFGVLIAIFIAGVCDMA
jgi:ABC-type phosphate transport system permease subunit